MSLSKFNKSHYFIDYLLAFGLTAAVGSSFTNLELWEICEEISNLIVKEGQILSVVLLLKFIVLPDQFLRLQPEDVCV